MNGNTSRNNSLIQRSLTTCIVGGGNAAHVLIPFLSEAGQHVHLLTRRPTDWHDVVYCEHVDPETGAVKHSHAGTLEKKSDKPQDVIPTADIIILCIPVHQYRSALERIGPYINREKEVFLGTIYGQAGFNWMVRDMLKEQKSSGLEENLVTFAIGNIPWMCRIVEYGQSVSNYGGMVGSNTVAVHPASKFDKLNRLLLQDLSEKPFHGSGAFVQVPNFLSLTLSGLDNQLVHPARYYGIWQQQQAQSSPNQQPGTWSSPADVPAFYGDFDQASLENMIRLDQDYESIRQAMRQHFPDHDFSCMLSLTELHNLNHNTKDLSLTSLRCTSIKPLASSFPTPTVVGASGTRHLNRQSHMLKDDIPYGLLVAKWFGEQLDVSTPFLDGVITWAQTLRGESFLDDHGKINKDYCLSTKYVCGIPESYGLANLKAVLD